MIARRAALTPSPHVPRSVRVWALAAALLLAVGACGDDPEAPPADVAADTADAIGPADGDVAERDTSSADADASAPDLDAVDASDAADARDIADPEDARDTADADEVTDADAPTDTDEPTDADALSDIADAEDDAGPDDADAGPDDADAGPDDADAGGPGPFDDLEGLTGAALRAALAARIDGHTALGYDGDGEAREVMFAVVDARDGRLECIYTGRTVAAEDPAAPPLGAVGPPIDTTPDADCRWPGGANVPGGCFFNTEHSWPQSAGASNEPARSDLHHLFPTWEYANNQRSNHPFGDTTCVASACPWHEGASELGVSASGATVFEVRPRYRGDVARAQFYFAVRYGKTIGASVEQALRGWHADDPPDDVERARNDAIELWQHNRNPFVDRPDFVDAISDF